MIHPTFVGLIGIVPLSKTEGALARLPMKKRRVWPRDDVVASNVFFRLSDLGVAGGVRGACTENVLVPCEGMFFGGCMLVMEDGNQNIKDVFS